MKNEKQPIDIAAWLKKEKWSFVILIIAAVVFFGIRMSLHTSPEDGEKPAEYAEYEKARVAEVLSDNTVIDPASDNAYRGEQLLLMEVQSGQYKGSTLSVNNYTGPLYGTPLKKGDTASIIINTYSSGDVRATVYEFNRIPALIGILAVFFAVTALIGGKTGIRSLVALILTILILFQILIPLLLKGAPTLPTVFMICAYITVVSFTLLGGVHRKTICASLGTIAGTALAMLFGLASQSAARISGLRMADVEPLLQLRQMGVPIGLQGLLVGGIIISALGAVMDVAMSISSALEELHTANPALSAKELFRSGMNIGRDMVGTMTNTLILAFLGSGFTLIIYLYSLGLSFYQLMPSAYTAIEVISGISSSIGMILAIPLTAFISALLLEKDKS
ncbi:MAG: YibE/F family protein [Solobacterium sp.]|nr:YibE/F family protein [Solobacterium sp.]